MMTEEHHTLTRIGRRAGVFDERIIHGFHFKDEQGRNGWHVTTWSNNQRNPEDYWIEGDKFHEVTALYLGVNFHIETGRQIVEIEERKRTAILNALQKWEDEESSVPR